MLEETFVVNKISGHLLFSTYIPSVLIVTMSWIRSGIERHKKIFLCVLWWWVVHICNCWHRTTASGSPLRELQPESHLESPLCSLSQLRLNNPTLTLSHSLSLSLQSMQTQQTLPPVSYTKAIDVWLATCVVFVFLRSSILARKQYTMLNSWKSRM